LAPQAFPGPGGTKPTYVPNLETPSEQLPVPTLSNFNLPLKCASLLVVKKRKKRLSLYIHLAPAPWIGPMHFKYEKIIFCQNQSSNLWPSADAITSGLRPMTPPEYRPEESYPLNVFKNFSKSENVLVKQVRQFLALP